MSEVESPAYPMYSAKWILGQAPMLAEFEETNGQRLDKLIGNFGYWSNSNAEIADDQIELFITTARE